MRKTTFILAAFVALATMGLVSCQKENTDTKTDTEQTHKDNATVARILDFKEQVEHYNGPTGTRDASYVSVEDAVWNLEALFNYTYAYPELCYSRTVSADTVMYLPLCSNDSVLMSDLASFYGDIFGAVNALYQSVELTDKQFILLNVEAGDNLLNQMEIILEAVQGSVDESRLPNGDPFLPGEWWYYGGNMGGWNSTEGDAAQMLTWWVNRALTPAPPATGYYCYTMITRRESTTPSDYPYTNPNYNVSDLYCEFEVMGNPYVDDSLLVLNSEQLNFHYHGELELVQNRLYQGNAFVTLTPFKVLIEADQEMENDRDYTRVFHHTKAWYGRRDLCLPNSHVRESLEP